MSLIAWGLMFLLLLLAGLGLDVLLGLRRLELLHNVPPRSSSGAPALSIVVAARDEERGIEAAARSLLAQDYANLEIVAVDDRSTDRTGVILDRLAVADPRLRVVHVRELPAGWLGKNHALSVGAAAARGEWLLFTDADIVMAPETLPRAVGFAERRGLDHLAVVPDLHMPGLLLKAFITSFIVSGMAALRPWKARDPGSRRSIGLGAFNLVRATAYARVGGHVPIRLRPDDDLKLGKILKASGAAQDVLLGKNLVSVEWYPSLRETIAGLMKNSFSVVEYRVPLMLGAVAGYVGMAVGPFAALLLGPGPIRLIGGLAVLILGGVHLRMTAVLDVPRRAALLYPVAHLLSAWIVLRALVVNLSQGGIVWRGTFYPLAELRRNRV